MNDKELAEIICRALLAIVAGIRRKYNLPDYRGVTLEIKDSPYSEPTITEVTE